MRHKTDSRDDLTLSKSRTWSKRGHSQVTGVCKLPKEKKNKKQPTWTVDFQPPETVRITCLLLNSTPYRPIFGILLHQPEQTPMNLTWPLGNPRIPKQAGLNFPPTQHSASKTSGRNKMIFAGLTFFFFLFLVGSPIQSPTKHLKQEGVNEGMPWEPKNGVRQGFSWNTGHACDCEKLVGSF